MILSVIIMTFNSEKYIEQTLDSIINQKTTFPYEIVISDDCSNDNTRIILNEFAQNNINIKLHFNEKNIGIVANFKNAIEQCKGKYIAYCGHDDYWHDETKLQQEIAFLEDNPEYGLVHTDYNILDESTGIITRNVHLTKNINIGQGYVADELIYSYYIGSCTPCFRKDIFEKYVPIDDFIKLNFPVEDWATYVVIAIYSKVGYINTSTSTLRIGHESASNQSDFGKAEHYLEGHERMFHYLLDKFPDEFICFGKDDFRIYRYISLLSRAYKIRNFYFAKIYALKLKKYNQKSLKIFCAKSWWLFKYYLIIKYIYNLTRKLRFKITHIILILLFRGYLLYL